MIFNLNVLGKVLEFVKVTGDLNKDNYQIAIRGVFPLAVYLKHLPSKTEVKL